MSTIGGNSSAVTPVQTVAKLQVPHAAPIPPVDEQRRLIDATLTTVSWPPAPYSPVPLLPLRWLARLGAHLGLQWQSADTIGIALAFPPTRSAA